jgi:hypothetical protein
MDECVKITVWFNIPSGGGSENKEIIFFYNEDLESLVHCLTFPYQIGQSHVFLTASCSY